jgi:hypothetical protein
MMRGGHLDYYPLNRYDGAKGRRGERIWFNVDLLWAGALVGAGVITLFV